MGLSRPTSVKEADFRLFHVGETAQEELSEVARQWLNPDNVERKIKEFTAFANLEFATTLFSNSTVVGVLRCDITTIEESDTEWLILANSTNVRSADVTCDGVLSSMNGEYLYLPISSFVLLKEHRQLLPMLSLTNTERFFVFFGGLRISPPHFGAEYFRLSLSPCEPRMIAEKLPKRQWEGSSIFYQIDNGDYLIVSPQGEIGFIPLDPYKEIQDTASDFDSFLRAWLLELPKAKL